MVEMRPLIGKQQLINASLVSTGTGAMDRDGDLVIVSGNTGMPHNSSDMHSTTQFSMSPWGQRGPGLGGKDSKLR